MESRKKNTVIWRCLVVFGVELVPSWLNFVVHCSDSLVFHRSIHFHMSSPSPSPENLDTSLSHSALINAKLVAIETVAANKKNKKASTKKTVKNKQFMHKFEASVENYIKLLNTFLKMHRKDNYQATVNHTFIFKIQVPPAKYKSHYLSCWLS